MRPRWGIIFGKSVGCCVRVVFIMFLFLQLMVYRKFFMGTVKYHADGCSYSLVFWHVLAVSAFPIFSMFVYVCKNPVVLRQLGSTTAVFSSITAAVEISGGYS